MENNGTVEGSEGAGEEQERTLFMSEIMTPDKANFSGHVHGGHLLKLLDQVAYACASRYTGKTMVTLSVDQVLFKKPVFVGDLVTCMSTINFVGGTSLEVGIRVVAENLKTREKRHTLTCYFTLVALDDKGTPTPIPPLKIDTEERRRHFDEAKARRELRIKALAKDSKK